MPTPREPREQWGRALAWPWLDPWLGPGWALAGPWPAGGSPPGPPILAKSKNTREVGLTKWYLEGMEHCMSGSTQEVPHLFRF